MDGKVNDKTNGDTGELKSQFGKWLSDQIEQRKMTDREFSRFVGVTQSAISKLVWHGIKETYGDKAVGDPLFDTLRKLAKATHTDIGLLARLAAPDATFEDQRDTWLLALIGGLDEDDRELVYTMILGLFQKLKDKRK